MKDSTQDLRSGRNAFQPGMADAAGRQRHASRQSAARLKDTAAKLGNKASRLGNKLKLRHQWGVGEFLPNSDTNVGAAGLDHVSKKLKTIRRKFNVPTEPSEQHESKLRPGATGRPQKKFPGRVVQVARVASKLQGVKGGNLLNEQRAPERGMPKHALVHLRTEVWYGLTKSTQVGLAHMKLLAGARQENKVRRSWQNRQTLAQKLKCGSHAALDYVGLKTAPTDRQDAHSSARWVEHQACAWLSPGQQWCWEATNAQNSNSVHEEDPTKVLVQQRHSGPS